MKTYLPFLWSLLLLLGVKSSQAQDPHFSQFAGAPAAFNPALSGVFSGNYRLAGVYRNQWATIRGSVPFRTYATSFDMRFEGNGRFDGIGASLTFLGDKAGTAELSSEQLHFAFSYIKALNYRGNHYLSTAMQAGVAQRSVDQNNFQFGSQYEEGGFNPNLPGEPLATTQVRYADISAGAFWYYAISDRTMYYASLAAFHFNRPGSKFTFGDESSELPMRYYLSAGAQFQLNLSYDLLLTAHYMQQSFFREMVFGGAYRYVFNPHERGAKTTGSAGVHYRLVGNHSNPINSEALILLVKADINGLTFGLSYDLNLSSLTASTRTHGAVELSMSYTGKFGSRRQNAKYCPNF
jgi:type IX secretion system PorP/SprF family membrane protein